MNNNTPILITGCHRSGTSMIAGIIHICGAYAGKVDKMYENIPIRQGIIKPILAASGGDIDGQYPLPTKITLRDGENFGKHITQYIQYQGKQPSEKWFYKDFRIVLTHMLWGLVFPDAKYVLVRRKDDDIIVSCLKTSYMKAFEDTEIQKKLGIRSVSEGWYWWLAEYKKRFNEMKKSGIQIKEVYPSKMIEQDFSEVKEIVEWLGLEWKEKEVKEFINPKLWRH